MSEILIDNRVIRVFVSSTFRDMQEDRNYLVKHIFPQLRKLCESRGVTWSDVDLRWGITDEEAAEGKVLPLCLEEIQRCRPYFIGLLGERYGWVPQPEEIPADLMERQPWLKDLLEHSVTELEITHGVLREEQTHRRAYFYFRDPNYILELPKEKRQNFITKDAGSAEKLTQLKQRIRAARDEEVCELHENYRDPQELGQWILEDFTRLIEDIYPSGEQPGELDREAAGHDAVARRHSNVYVGRSEYFDQLDSYLADGGQPLVVCGESGIGKSALLANWFLDYRSRHPDALTLIHFIGSTADSADAPRLMQRIMLQLKRSFELPDEVPSMPDQIREAFPQWLADVAGRGRIVMVIDSLNQLDNRDHAADLGWLPAVLPQNIRLIVSTLPGRSLDAVRSRGWQEMNVEPLTVPERRELLEKFLAQYSRRLSPERVDEIASCDQSANPLFLRALLDELRQFGEHERLGEMIRHYLAATDPGDLYRRILQRWERDYGCDLVRGSLSLLWASRRGLSERELLDLLGKDETPLPHANWTPFFLASESVLALCSGLFRFSHDYIREAIQTLFLPTEELRNSRRCELAEYWQQQKELSSRALEELPWQWQQAEKWELLKSLLTERSVFLRLRSDERGKQDLQAYWLALKAHFDPCESYRDAVDDWETDTASPNLFAKYLNSLGLFHKERAEYQAAKPLYRRALAIVERAKGSQHLDVANILNNLAQLLQDTNRLSDAEPMMRRFVAIYEQAFGAEHPEVALGLTNLAALLQTTNRLAEAEQMFRRALAINEQHYGDENPIVAGDLNNLAVLLEDTNHLAEAERLLRRAVAIFERAKGSQHPDVAASLNNLASLLLRDNRLLEAEPLLRRALTINEQYYGGEHPYVAGDLNSLATLLKESGRLKEASRLYRTAVNIVELAYGDQHPDFGIKLSNLALFLQETGRLADAEPMLRRTLAINENSYGAEHPHVAKAAVNLAQLLRTTNCLVEAESLYRRAVAIHEKSDRGQHPDFAAALNGLGALLYATSSFSDAEPLIRRALSMYEASYRPEHSALAMCLNNLGQVLKVTNRLSEAEPKLRRALVIIEKSLGADHPHFARCLNSLSQLLMATDQLPEAESMMRRALAIDEQFYGTEHSKVAGDLNDLAELLMATNRFVEAEPLYRRAVAIDEQSEEGQHPAVATRLSGLASLLLVTNRLEEAESVYRRVLDINEDSCGPRHCNVARDLNNLAQVLQATNRLAEAEPILRRAVAINEQSLGAKDPAIGSVLTNLAAVFRTTYRLSYAEPLYRRTLSINMDSFGQKHPSVIRELKNFGRLLRETNRMPEGEQLHRQVLEINEFLYGSAHPDVARELNNLAMLLKDTNRLAAAEPILRRAVEIFAFALTNEHPNTVAVRENYERLLNELKLLPKEIDQRILSTTKTQRAFQPIASEIELQLGPCKPVAEVLAGLDIQNRYEGRPEIYYLKPDQVITPHLERLLLPTPLSLICQGLSAMHAGSHALAAALFEAAYELNQHEADATELESVIRMNRGVAIRELGGLELASQELSAVIVKMKRDKNQPDAHLGRCLFHLAKCQYELGETSRAIETLELSFQAYANAPLDDPMLPSHVEEAQLLRHDLHAKTPPPQRVEVDIETELASARERLEAISRLNTHPLDQPAGALLDQMLGTVGSIPEVLKTLDEQCRKEGKPPVYFLPLHEPIAPHLDELLGPTGEEW